MRNVVVVLALLPVVAGAMAQDCVDWSESLSEPLNHQDLRGTHLQLVGDLCYIAGDSLLVVDVSDVTAPVVLGRVPLPAPAAALALHESAAYLACGDSGLVEIRCDDPALPVRGRTYAAGTGAMAMSGSLLAAVVGGTAVHLVDVAAGGDLAPVGVHVGTRDVHQVGFVGTVLVLMDLEGGLTPIDVGDPATPAAESRYRSGSMYGATTMTVGPAQVFVIDLDAYMPDYEMIYYSSIKRLRIDAAGGLVVDGSSQLGLGRLEYAEDLLVHHPEHAAVTRLLDPETLATELTVGASSSLGIGSGRMAAVATTTGLTLWTGIDHGIVQPVVGFGDFGYETGTGRYHCSSRLETYYGGIGGGYSATLDYEIFDLQDPLAPVGMGPHTVRANASADDGPPSLGVNIYAPDFYVVTEGHYGGKTLRFYDLQSGTLVDSMVAATPLFSWFFPGSLWVHSWYDGELVYYRVDPEAGLQPRAAWPRPGSISGVISPDGVLFFVAAGTGYTVIDTADPDSVEVLGTVELAFTAPASGTWKDRTFHYWRSGELRGLDFSDPLAPVELPATPCPSTVSTLCVKGERALLLYPTGWQSARFDADGSLVLVSPVIPGDFRYIAWDDDHVFAGYWGTGIHFYDISDAAQPRFVGQARGGSGTLDVVAGYPVSGGSVLPLPCSPSTPVLHLRPDLALAWRTGCGRGADEFAVTIMGGGSFDAARIDVASVVCGPRGASAAGPPRLADIDGDGDLDLLVAFRGAAAGLACDARSATVSGRLVDGAAFAAEVALTDTPVAFGPAGLAIALAPNPFNPQVQVRFVQAQTGLTRVAVYDLRGRRVAVLADGRRQAGAHVLEWNGRDEAGRALASGTYFVRFETGRGVQTAKAMLLR